MFVSALLLLLCCTFTSCSKVEAPSPAQNNEGSSLAVIDNFRNRPDGVFYEEVPQEFQKFVNPKWQYKKLHVFVKEDTKQISWLFEFENEAQKATASQITSDRQTSYRAKTWVAPFGTHFGYWDCVGSGKSCIDSQQGDWHFYTYL